MDETLLELIARGNDKVRIVQEQLDAEFTADMIFEEQERERAVELMRQNLEPCLREYLSFYCRNDSAKNQNHWEAAFDLQVPDCALIRIYGFMNGEIVRHGISMRILDCEMEVDKEMDLGFVREIFAVGYSYEEYFKFGFPFVIAKARQIGDNRADVQAEVDLEATSCLLDACFTQIELGNLYGAKVDALIAIGRACVEIGNSLVRMEGAVK